MKAKPLLASDEASASVFDSADEYIYELGRFLIDNPNHVMDISSITLMARILSEQLSKYQSLPRMQRCPFAGMEDVHVLK